MAPFLLPYHQTGRADFPHQMWPTTFDAECGPGSYVALAGMGLTGVVQEIFSAT
jgi:hypothetical protein